MNQQEQIAQGSLRSSHRNVNPIMLKRVNLKEQTKVVEFLTSSCKDLVISQRINSGNTIGSSDRQNSVASYAEIPLKKGTFFVHTSSSKSEPGFLVFMPKSNPVFVKYNLSKRERELNKGQPICYILRMRVSQEIYNGTIFVATLDSINHSLTLEDIYLWKNINIFETKTFSERRAFMKEFVERHWVPDVRLLGGIVTTIMNPKNLESLKELENINDFTKVFLIPDSFNKRRFTFNLNESVAQIQNGYYARKVEKEKTKPVVELQKTVEPSKLLLAKAVKIPLLPDIYELYDMNGNSLNKAAVQQLDLSKLLKESGNEINVKIKYNEDFKRYEIIGLHTP